MHPAAQGGIAVQGCEVAEQLAGGGKQRGLAGDQRLMGDVLRQHGFPGAVLTDQDDVGGVIEKVERHQGLDGGAITALWPGPVEVAERFEAANMRLLQPPLQSLPLRRRGLRRARSRSSQSISGASQGWVATSL